MSASRSESSHTLLKSLVYGAAIVLALVHVFVIFRGLSSPQGMEQAQLAREMARGNGYVTQMIRPHAWSILIEKDPQLAPAKMAEITQPPLQPFIWSLLFRPLQAFFEFNPTQGGTIYALDRIIAGMGVIWLLLTLLIAHGTAHRLFDSTVANVSLVCLLVCEPLWDLAVSGSPNMLLLFLFTLAWRFLVQSVSETAEGSKSGFFSALGVGFMASLMILTQWMAIWLVLGLLAGCFLVWGQKRAWILAAVLPALLTFIAWITWLTVVSGDPLGGGKVLFQSLLAVGDLPTLLPREFHPVLPPMLVEDVGRKLILNLKVQLDTGIGHLGVLLPALMFFPALLHPFRRVETARLCRAIGTSFLFLLTGLCLIGLPNKEIDDQALYPVFLPAFTTFGVAMLAIFWRRLQTGTTFWQQSGFGVLAVALSMLPMVATLPSSVKNGLLLRGRTYPHWPPYIPSQVTMVKYLLEPGEILFSDAPWFVAWYVDRPTVWLPVKRKEFDEFVKHAESIKQPVAGIIITPVSSKLDFLMDVFKGPYKEWTDLVLRGPFLALDKDLMPHPDFAFRLPIPLMATQVGSKESSSLEMTFYTNKKRSLNLPKEEKK